MTYKILTTNGSYDVMYTFMSDNSGVRLLNHAEEVLLEWEY